jgi:positive regulator of sigma E activity
MRDVISYILTILCIFFGYILGDALGDDTTAIIALMILGFGIACLVGLEVLFL